jgi:hypothetical protein
VSGVKIGKSVLTAMATVAIAGCGGSGNPASEAKTYVRTISPDAAQVQADEIKVGLDILHNDLTGLAQDAQTAHDDFANDKIDIIGAGSNVGDNSRLGNAEYQMEDAINELKNGMGAVVAFAENPSAGTLGAAGSKLDQGVTDWDQAATVLWTMAGRASEIPSLAGSAPATTNSNTATTPATTPNPATSSVPSWVQAARSGCPAGEVLLKTLSNGQPTPYGNDGCVTNGGPYECSPSEPTCDPANAPGTTPASPPKPPNCASSGLANGTSNGQPACVLPAHTCITLGEVPSTVNGQPAGCVKSSPSHIDCGTFGGWTGAYVASANGGQGGCVYTFATGYKITAPPGMYMYSFQNFVSDVGGAGLEHCTLFIWSNGSSQTSKTVCGS